MTTQQAEKWLTEFQHLDATVSTMQARLTEFSQSDDTSAKERVAFITGLSAIRALRKSLASLQESMQRRIDPERFAMPAPPGMEDVQVNPLGTGDSPREP